MGEQNTARRTDRNDRPRRSGLTERSSAAPEGSSAAAPSKTNAKAEKPDRAADLLPPVSLPKGGDAICGLGEKFSVNAATGPNAMSVPLLFSPGRSRFTPALQLSYDSAWGNGPFGFGWSLGAPAITRKTGKGLPRSCDGDESDVFIHSGAEDLVPVLNATGTRKTMSRTVFGTAFQIFFYRPRIEGLSSGSSWSQHDKAAALDGSLAKGSGFGRRGYQPNAFRKAGQMG